ncbi:MAG: DUF6797 domain-containing protein [Chthoniobacteraceae bacterium]
MMRSLSLRTLAAFLACLSLITPALVAADDLFARENLVAWCIVPFDAKKRGPKERAEMLQRLQLRRLAYDWRAEHVPQFEEEVETMARHGIEFTAWWFPGTLDAEARRILEVIGKHKITPQLWVMGGGDRVRDAAEQERRVEAEAARIRTIAEAAAPLGCNVALYNHGGWFGQPDNQIAIIERLQKDGIRNVGIVYNLHHAHDELDRFAVLLGRMKPHLLALNLNGMTRDGDKKNAKILPIGQGEFDAEILRVIRESGWKGPIGILNHTDADAEEQLRKNLDGLDRLLRPEAVDASLDAPIPAPFIADQRPLEPALWPHWQAPVNRDRLYDFYTKQARHFRNAQPRRALIAQYPGLDAGTQGHWGNQNEDTWRDGRWARSDHGSLFSAVFRGGNLTIAKGVAVRLGEQGELAACFDPEWLDFRIVWKGGFISLDDTRHGFMTGATLAGEVVEQPAAVKRTGRYRGCYRHGARVLFAYEENGQEVLDTAWVQDGKYHRERAPLSSHPLRDLTKGGPAQWPEILKTRGELGTGSPLAIDTLTLPEANPWGALFFVGDHDFFANGDIALCSFTGDVWRVSGVDAGLQELRWKRVATGLHQPLGLVVVDDKVCVLGRDQITRLHDLNADGEADFYECVANTYTTSENGHDYVCGLQRDQHGAFYFASSRQGVCRVTPDGAVEVIATGFRNPAGIGLSADGVVTTSVQEGEWTPTSAVCQLEPGGYYGYGGPRQGIETKPPLVYLPRGVDNSSGGQLFVDSDRWVVPRGQLLHFSSGAGTHFLLLREQVGDTLQATAAPLPGEFRSGAHRGRFSPVDGQLYVSGINGWGSYTVADGSLQRVRYTGEPMQLPTAIESRDNGVLITFAQPLDPKLAADPTQHFAQAWNYRTSQAYGSPEFSVRHPETIGHDVLEIHSAHLLPGGRALFLEIPQLLAANQIHLNVATGENRAQDLFVTAHRLGAPFTEFAGYTAIPKIPVHHHHAAAPIAPPAKPNPFRAGPGGRELRIAAAEGLQFSEKRLVAKCGERLTLAFENPDAMPHNWALLKPGTLATIGEILAKEIADPAAASRQYIPQHDAVLAYTDILAPKSSARIHFTAPAVPGDYPYVCTFPGHWQVMNGILKVE